MTVSIIICTRNRAESLRSTLASIAGITVPAGWSVELLVVDNGSGDHTQAVVNEACTGQICTRYLNEPKPGLSLARNAGLNNARGEIILFTDDDVRVPLNWVVGMAGPILKGIADAVAGGVSFPAKHNEALARLKLSTGGSWFALTEKLDRNHPARMVGANMAFHRRVLDRIPGFDIELGAGALGFYDETLFSFQLLSAGYKLIGAFDDPVEHHFDLARLTRDSLMDTARKMGRSHAFLLYHWEHQRLRQPIPKLIRCQFRHLVDRLLNRRRETSNHMLFNQVLRREEKLGLHQEHVAQRPRPFKYALHGLKPLVAEQGTTEAGKLHPPSKTANRVRA